MKRWLPLLLLLTACSGASDDGQVAAAEPLPEIAIKPQTRVITAVPELRPQRPRVLPTAIAARNSALPETSPLAQEINRRYLGCKDDRRFHLLNCWLRTQRDDIGLRFIRNFPKMHISEASDAGAVSSAWEVALVYDALVSSPLMDAESELIARTKIKAGLRQTLLVLDEDSASLWHNRASLAASAIIMAVAIGDADTEARALLARALPHFLDTVKAIGLTEAWPEGYNYWIQNRAMLFAHAVRAFTYGFIDHPESRVVKAAFCRHALWPLYATRPDHRVEGLGDEGSRVDLAEETRPFVDAAASLCESKILAGYSDYLRARYPGRSYYEDYRWIMALFNDPALAPTPMSHPSLGFLESVQAKHIAFGLGAMNQFYFRTRWDSDAVYLSARAGANFSHHGHYDAGHFSLFYDKPLIVNSSGYGKYFGDNRLHYSIRTVAKNSVLVLRPDEKVKPNHKFKENVSDGGQRITLPTGSAITSVTDWQAQLGRGQHLEGGAVLAHTAQDDAFFYTHMDLTGAYNNTRYDDNGKGGKVERVERTLLFLQPDNRLLVLDDVKSTDPGYVVKSLFHSIHKPNADGSKVLRGSAEDGIQETTSDTIGITNGEGRLTLQRLLPRAGLFRLVGGTQHRFYVESDGDESSLDGRYYSADASDQKWFEPAYWRTELQAQHPAQEQLHLASLAVSRGSYRPDRASLRAYEQDYLIIATEKCYWIHALTAQAKVEFDATDKSCVIATGNKKAQLAVRTKTGPLVRGEHGVGWASSPTN